MFSRPESQVTRILPAGLALVAALALGACGGGSTATTETATTTACTVTIAPQFQSVTIGPAGVGTFTATGTPPGGTYSWDIAYGGAFIDLTPNGSEAAVRGRQKTPGTGAGATIRVSYDCPGGGAAHAVAGVRVA